MERGPILLAVAFDRAVGDRLLSAARLALSLPHFFRGVLETCDLGFRRSPGFFAAAVRLEGRGYRPEMRERLAFWAARAGGIAIPLSSVAEEESAAFQARFDLCDVKVREAPPQALYEILERILDEAGAPADRKRLDYPRPTLTMDVGGPGWEGIVWEPDEAALFVPGNIAPPVGDEFAVSLRAAGADRPFEIKGRVERVRTPEEVAPGAPAGFELRLQSPPPAVVAALAPYEAKPALGPQRSAPRYPVKAPVRVSGRGGGAASVIIPPPPPMPAPAEREGGPATARIEYQTDQELVADYLENLSQGGAFVRTARPAPIGSRLTLEMSLPGGLSLQALSTVVFADEKGMGVKFDLDARGEGILAAAIARITGRPRRALVVEGDAGARAALSEALSTRGFEVLTAENGERGLHVLAEEVLTLDLLVTGLELPGMRGEALIRAIRLPGGESDLAIAAVADDVDEAKERRLKDGGADAIFDRSLGAEKLAESADGLIEKKRLAQKG